MEWLDAVGNFLDSPIGELPFIVFIWTLIVINICTK